jgi:hypothetical protein
MASRSLVLGADPPSALEQMRTFVSEEEVGFARLQEGDVRALVSGLPFQAAMSVLAALYGFVDDQGWGAARQVELAKAFYGPTVGARYEGILSAEPDRHVFAPQPLHVLMRILIEDADCSPTEEWTDEHHAILCRAVLGAHSVVEEGLDMGVEEGAMALLAYLVQASGYHSRHQQLVEMARAMELHRLGSEDDELCALPEHCPLEDWLLEEYGLSFDEQFTLGFALAAMAHAWDPGNSHQIPAGHVDDLLLKMGLVDRREQAIALVSSDREEFRTDFAETVGPGALAWDVRAFKGSPFLRFENGDLLLLNGSWMLSWLSEGFYFRGLRHAQALDANLPTEGERTRRPNGQRYTQSFGRIFERYGLRLAESCHNLPSSLLLGAVVHGEQPYNGG